MPSDTDFGYICEKLALAAGELEGDGDEATRTRKASRHLTAVFPLDFPAAHQGEIDHIKKTLGAGIGAGVAERLRDLIDAIAR